eukprot:7371703-Alexandrium_andersonii.AAC.1
MGYKWRFLVFELAPRAQANDDEAAAFFALLAEKAKSEAVKWMLGEAGIRIYGVCQFMAESGVQAALAACHEELDPIRQTEV